VDLLAPKSGGVYVDGTAGAGGHAGEILRRSSPDGRLIGLDRDEDAVVRCRARLAAFGGRVTLRQANFREIPAVLAEFGIEAVDGVLLDLGVSTYHLKTPERGFSFSSEGPLDMRMDRRQRETAADIVNTLSRDELARIIREFGEERKAGAVASAIVRARSRKRIATSVELAGIVASVFPRHAGQRIHPATRTFQAIRIAVNDELAALAEGLEGIVPILKQGGRVVVISFHSLEDRIVKQFFARLAKGCICPPKVPLCRCGQVPVLRIITKSPVAPEPEEREENPAARSAKLRAAQKL
jgi:16S rRNA (cytosine1402-N4)-methyltransferase